LIGGWLKAKIERVKSYWVLLFFSIFGLNAGKDDEKGGSMSHEFGFVVSRWWGISDGELGWCGGWASLFCFFGNRGCPGQLMCTSTNPPRPWS